jgi:predicted esterase
VTTASRPAADIHADGPIVSTGVSLEEAHRAMILVHGRGATPASILTLTEALPDDLGFSFIAPGASETGTHPRSWYPHSFLAPASDNEPALSSALAKIGDTVESLAGHDIPPERTILLGFSQGACLVTEFAARSARRWGAMVALTGGLIGDRVTPRDDAGSLEGTPAFFGTSDSDPHVPLQRVEESAQVLGRMGAQVETRIYPGLPHTVIRDELEWVAEAMRRVARDDSAAMR